MRKNNLLFTFLLYCFLSFTASKSFSQLSNTKTGLWNDESIWQNHQLPTIADEVVLQFDITIDQNSYCKSLNSNGHKVVISAGNHLYINTARPRTANIFGFALSEPNCRIDKMTDSSTYSYPSVNTDYKYNNDLLGKINYYNNTDAVVNTLFFYDTLNRLVKIKDPFIDPSLSEWTMQYEGNTNRIKAFYHTFDDGDDFVVLVTDTFNVTYPSADKVVISISDPTHTGLINTITDTLYFDSNRNPTRFARVRVNAVGDSSPAFVVTALYNTGIFNPTYTYGENDYAYLSPYYDIRYVFNNGIEYYKSMPRCGLHLATVIKFTSFINPFDNYESTSNTIEVNVNGYPLEETNEFGTKLLYQYTCH